MTTTLRPLSVNARGIWSSQVEEKSKHLGGLTPIISAVVIPVRQASDKPAFRVQVRLEVPGPGLHAADKRRKRRIFLLLRNRALRAEAIGKTLQAALLKATEYLEHRVKARPAQAPAVIRVLVESKHQVPTKRPMASTPSTPSHGGEEARLV